MQRIKAAKRGSSLIIVICILAVFSILSATLMLSAYNLIVSESKSFSRSQVQVLAETFSDTITEELTVADTLLGEGPTNPSRLARFVNDSIYTYIDSDPVKNGHVMSPIVFWFYFNENDVDSRHSSPTYTKLSFTSIDDHQSDATVRMTMHWTTDANGDSGLNNGLSVQTGSGEAAQYDKIRLVIVMAVEFRGEEYFLTSEYGLTRTRTYLNDAVVKEEWIWVIKERY